MGKKNILTNIPAEQAAEKNESTDKTDDNELTQVSPVELQKEIGGPKGPEPTRYGDWEKRGRCIDF